VITIVCQHEHRKKNGVTKSGTVRYRCCDCGKSWTESTSTLGGMRIGMDRAEQIIGMVCEGMSVMATARVTKTDPHTVINLVNYVGERCEAYMQDTIKGIAVEEIQMDEQWQFVLCKRRTARENKYVGGCGDSWCYTAVERSTKLVVAWHMGKRDEKHTDSFIRKLAAATTGRFNLASDGWTAYPMAVWQNLENRVDYGMLVKIYGEADQQDRRRYSPAKIISTKKSRVLGVPEAKRICTSHVERLNGSTRNFCKRMARLTYAFSKKWNNHRSALGLHFAHYNFCRAHKSLKGETPAMAHGIANHVWTVRELLVTVAA
jgi:transposase-like protein/IS1 family transposase